MKALRLDVFAPAYACLGGARTVNQREMRTNIVIDDKLMRDTLRATGLKTKREAVELGLRTVLRLHQQAEIKRWRGKLDWQGDLYVLRTDK